LPRAERAGSSIHASLDLFDVRDNRIRRRHIAEARARQGYSVSAHRIAHRLCGHEREGLARRRFNVEVVVAKEESCSSIT
jgi:transposase InsO family protein